MNAQRLKKWRVRFSIIVGLLCMEQKAFALSGLERQAFITEARRAIRLGLTEMFPKGYKTLSLDTHFQGLSQDGKRKQVIQDACGKTHTLFIRIFYEGMSLEKRRRVLWTTQHMADIWDGPHVLWHDKKHRVMITDFISSSKHSIQTPEAYFKDSKNLRGFVQKLRRSHKVLKESPIMFPQYPLCFRAQKRLRELLQAVPHLKHRLRRAERFLGAFKTPCTQDVVHGDIQADNILIAKKDHLVDWTEMAYGDIFEDLGALSAHLKFTPHQNQQLLKAYFGGYTPAVLEKLNRYAALNRLNRGCILLREGWRQLQKDKAKLHGRRFGLAQNLKMKKGLILLSDFLD